MSERSANDMYEDVMHGFEQARRTRRDRRAALAELESMNVDGAAPDGSVSVTVTADGVMTGLRLHDTVQGMRPSDIADLVLRTYLSVQRIAAAQATELAVTALGEDGFLHRRLRWRQEFVPAAQRIEVPSVIEDDEEEATSFFRNL